ENVVDLHARERDRRDVEHAQPKAQRPGETEAVTGIGVRGAEAGSEQAADGARLARGVEVTGEDDGRGALNDHLSECRGVGVLARDGPDGNRRQKVDVPNLKLAAVELDAHADLWLIPAGLLASWWSVL